jgi:hypothetical protein
MKLKNCGIRIADSGFGYMFSNPQFFRSHQTCVTETSFRTLNWMLPAVTLARCTDFNIYGGQLNEIKNGFCCGSVSIFVCVIRLGPGGGIA